MPTGNRIRANNVYGTISDNPLLFGSANFNSNSLPLLPVVASAHAVVVLDPQRVHGNPEIIVVTGHTTSSTVATILRGQYSTLAREHPQGTTWAHVPIDEDFTEIVTSGTRPSNPYTGQMIYETDTVGYKFWNGSAWTGLSSPPRAKGVMNPATTIAMGFGAYVPVTFDGVDEYDTDNIHGTPNTRFKFPFAGVWHIETCLAVQVTIVTTGNFQIIAIVKNGGESAVGDGIWLASNETQGTGGRFMTCSYEGLFAVNDYVVVWAKHDASSGTNLVLGVGSNDMATYCAVRQVA